MTRHNYFDRMSVVAYFRYPVFPPAARGRILSCAVFLLPDAPGGTARVPPETNPNRESSPVKAEQMILQITEVSNV